MTKTLHCAKTDTGHRFHPYHQVTPQLTAGLHYTFQLKAFYPNGVRHHGCFCLSSARSVTQTFPQSFLQELRYHKKTVTVTINH